MVILFALLSAVAVSSAGCGTFASVKYFGNPANPFPNVRTVAVAPFVNLSAEPSVDFIEVADIFAGELAQFPGFQVRRPAVLIADARQHGVPLPFPDVSAAVKLAQAVGADAIVIGAITEYDPYYPPRVSVALQLVHAGEKIDPVMDISPWVESGRPLAIQREDAPRLLAMFEDTFDSSKRFVRMEIQGYAKTHISDDRVFEEDETFLRIMNKYMQFV
ncbi:MAG: hypothetical protein RDV41_10070, partial [Planctomycetota bacterium]|nr:hypothetical protein [Planctomycetota bacterium]